MRIGKKLKMLLVLLVSTRGNQGLCLKYMPAGKNSCKITFHLLGMCQSQIVDFLLRVHSTILISLLPFPSRDHLNSTHFPGNISTVELVISNRKQTNKRAVHRILEWFGVKRTLKIIQFLPQFRKSNLFSV